MAQKTLIDVNNLGIKGTSVRGISFDVREKEIVSILGRSGSGKTLVLLAMAGMIEHDGKIIISRRVDPKEFIGHGFFEKADEPNEDETVSDYLFLTENMRSDDMRRFRDMTAMEKALVSLKKADREVMILDEPTKNLTREERRIFWNSIPEGRTIIFSTKDEEEARLAKVIVRL